MKFTKFNKAIAAAVLVLLALLSIVFKTDLSGYGELVTSVIVALIPVAVYFVPNLKVVADGADPGVEAVVEAATEVLSKVPKR
jgi:hypothetical protein